MKLAKENPLILSEPAPRVILESFGDSALNFTLMFFLPNLENRGMVIHEMHIAIERAFREAGIEIAFPQHDVHIRSIDIADAFLKAASNVVDPAKSTPLERAA